mmetsp:Transcript_10334/g.19506  ORF Transcript_10334/g.19506 Transcript_10334/m.19506 type:complete len:106 (-) Transcript_10334:525-842(-)
MLPLPPFPKKRKLQIQGTANPNCRGKAEHAEPGPNTVTSVPLVPHFPKNLEQSLNTLRPTPSISSATTSPSMQRVHPCPKMVGKKRSKVGAASEFALSNRSYPPR